MWANLARVRACIAARDDVAGLRGVASSAAMRSALIAVLVALLVAPAGAAAQSAPFQPLPQAPPTAPEPVAPAPGGVDEGITALQQGFLILAGVVLVLGIGVAIARDARRHAPVEGRAAPGGALATAATADGERRRPDPRAAQKQKASSKRARQARKKNRPVRK